MSLGNTTLNDLQAEYPSQYDRQEWRRERYGFVDCAFEQTLGPDSIISKNVFDLAKQSEDLQLNIPVMDYKDITLTTNRTCNIQPFENDSNMITLVWKTMVADISMMPQQYNSNVIDYRTDLNKKLDQVGRSMLAAMDQDIQVTIDAAKAQFFNSTLIPTQYPLNIGAISSSQAQKQFLFNDLQSIQEADDFNSEDLHSTLR